MHTPLLVLCLLATTVLSAPSSFPRRTTNATTTAANQRLIEKLDLAATGHDRLSLLPKPQDHKFDFLNPPFSNLVTTGRGGHTVRADRAGFPALIGTGLSMTVGFISACGFNTPHVHPRSAELNIVVQGSLVTEFVAENGVDPIINTLSTNQATVFPQGAIHTEFNPDCTPAIFVAAFASEDPGVLQVAQGFLGLEDDIVTAALGEAFSGDQLDTVRNAVPANVVLGVEACLAKCGIKKL